MSPASAKLTGMVVAIVSAEPTRDSNASPDAPVPMMILSVISSNWPPMSSSAVAIFWTPMAPRMVPPRAISGPFNSPSFPRMPEPMPSPAPSPASVAAGMRASVRFAFAS